MNKFEINKNKIGYETMGNLRNSFYRRSSRFSPNFNIIKEFSPFIS